MKAPVKGLAREHNGAMEPLKGAFQGSIGSEGGGSFGKANGKKQRREIQAILTPVPKVSYSPLNSHLNACERTKLLEGILKAF